MMLRDHPLALPGRIERASRVRPGNAGPPIDPLSGCVCAHAHSIPPNGLRYGR